MRNEHTHYAEVYITLQATLRLPADPADGIPPASEDWVNEAHEICQEDVLFEYASREPVHTEILTTWTDDDLEDNDE